MRWRRWWHVVAVLVFAAAAGPLRADEAASTLLRSALETLNKAESMSAEVATVTGSGPTAVVQKGTVILRRPGLCRADLQGQRPYLCVADGKYLYTFSGGATYLKRSLDPAAGIPGPWGAEVNAFFTGARGLENAAIRPAGTERVSGVECDLVEVSAGTPARATTYAIGKKDHLLYRSSWSDIVSQDGGGPTRSSSVSRTSVLSNVKLNVPLERELFAFVPPAGVRLDEGPDRNASLVAVGKPAPDFALRALDGSGFTLKETCAGRKAVILYFWFYG